MNRDRVSAEVGRSRRMAEGVGPPDRRPPIGKARAGLKRGFRDPFPRLILPSFCRATNLPFLEEVKVVSEDEQHEVTTLAVIGPAAAGRTDAALDPREARFGLPPLPVLAVILVQPLLPQPAVAPGRRLDTGPP